MPRVVVLVLNGLDWQTWTREQDVLSCLRDRFESPVRVYGTSPHTTSGTHLSSLLHASSRIADMQPCVNSLAVQSVLGFMTCRQQVASQSRRDASRPSSTKRQATQAVQRALPAVVPLALFVTDAASCVAAGVIRDQPMPFPPSYYQLTPAEMADNNYPVPVLDPDTGELRCPPGFVVTQPAGSGIARTPAFDMLVRQNAARELTSLSQNNSLLAQALDCEMCYTATGLEVTRCSVVDSACAVVYDTLVLPDTPILDYNTAHSGITAQLMSGVTTRLADVQAHLLEIVAEETLLVRRLTCVRLS